MKFTRLVARDAATGKELWTQALCVANYGNAGGNAGTNDNEGGDGPAQHAHARWEFRGDDERGAGLASL